MSVDNPSRYVTERWVMGLTYELGERDGRPFIRCKLCGLASYNPHDIRERYCGHCGRFHEGGVLK